MSPKIIALALGLSCLSACGDSAHLIPDASRDAPPAKDAAQTDGPMPDAFVDLSPILRYDFEESSTVVADTSGRHKDGTLSDVAAWTANGRNGRGLALANPVPPPPPDPILPATQFVSLPSGVLTGVSDFTITTWVKVNTISNWVRIYDFGNGEAAADNRFMFLTLLGYTPGSNSVFDGLHSTSFSAAPPPAETFLGTKTLLPVGVWKHITLTGSGGDRVLYIDGFPAASTSGGATVPPSEMEPLAGSSWLGRSRFPDPGLNGTLDDFRIYNRVLTTPEIADLAWPQHDYSYWRFDEMSGLTTKDSSDNTIHTTLASGATWTTGRLGGAVDLAGGAGDTNGMQPHVVLDSSPLASCTTQLTVAVWVKLRHTDNFARIFDFGNGGTFIYLAATDGAGIHLGMGKTATPAFNLTAQHPVPPDSAWHHVALTIDPTGLASIYFDGVLDVVPAVSTMENPSDYTATTENWLGRSRFPSDQYLNGAIDDLRISCRAYTADEIKNLANPATP